MEQEVSYAAWPVEEAWRYYVSAFIIEYAGEMKVAEVNAALSLEILIKSFFMTEVSGHGTEYALYKPNIKAMKQNGVKDKHHLHQLAMALPSNIRNKIFTAFDMEMLSKRGRAFPSLRYGYEQEAMVGASSILRQIAGDAIPRVVAIYKNNGSQDGWINDFDNIRQRAQKKYGTRL